MNFRLWLRLALGLTTTLILTACGQQPPAQESCNFVQNQFGRRVHWARTPIRFYADASVNDQQYRVIIESMEFWNEQFDRPVFEMIGRTSELPAPRLTPDGRVLPDGFNGIYIADPRKFENSPYRNEQARASISFRGDFIYEADILVDSSESFFYEDENSPLAQGRIHFKSLMIHELGHVLGLDHIEESDSVMAPILPPGFHPSRVQLSTSDFESLSCQY
jgi:hypothetical protein